MASAIVPRSQQNIDDATGLVMSTAPIAPFLKALTVLELRDVIATQGAASLLECDMASKSYSLHQQIRRNRTHADIVDEILNAAPELANLKDSRELTPLLLACYHQNFAFAIRIASHAATDVTMCDTTGHTALMYAVRFGNEDLVNAIVGSSTFDNKMIVDDIERVARKYGHAALWVQLRDMARVGAQPTL